MANAKPSLRNALSKAERSELALLEADVAENMEGFIKAGLALQAIREKQLFREDYATWEEYLRERWGFARMYAGRLIAAAAYATECIPLGYKPPKTEREARTKIDKIKQLSDDCLDGLSTQEKTRLISQIEDNVLKYEDEVPQPMERLVLVRRTYDRLLKHTIELGESGKGLLKVWLRGGALLEELERED